MKSDTIDKPAIRDKVFSSPSAASSLVIIGPYKGQGSLKVKVTAPSHMESVIASIFFSSFIHASPGSVL